MFLGREEKAMDTWKIANSLRWTAGSPPWRPAIQCLRYRQNVAGLWLKYGAKSLKIEASLQCGIVVRMRRFVDDNR
jgi:hypothetical protein